MLRKELIFFGDFLVFFFMFFFLNCKLTIIANKALVAIDFILKKNNSLLVLRYKINIPLSVFRFMLSGKYFY